MPSSRPFRWSLRARLVGLTLLAATPALALVVGQAAVQAPLSVPTAGAHEAVVRDVLLVVSAVVLLVGIAVASATRLISNPLRTLREVTRRLSGGDLAARAPTDIGAPEWREFALAFNHMADTLEERERQLTALAEHSPDGIARLGLDGQVLYANPALGRLLEMPAGALLGRIVTDVVPPALAETLEALGVLADSRGPGDDIVEGDVTLTTIRGTRVTDVRLVPERGDDGTPVARLAVLRDVTAARQTAEALRQAQKLDSIGHLAGGIAHDFNNLLTGIVGYADLALEDLPSDASARHDVQALRDAAMRSTGMTRQLLTFARTQAPTLVPADVGDVVADVAPLLERLLGAGVALSIERGTDVPAADVDRGQLEQVLVNLGVNARDAMPSGGTLTIRTRAADVDASKAARIGVRLPGRYAAIDVEDTGTGMPPAVMARIFEPFFSTKAPGKGTGLGLSTCYAIARDHGGVLAVSSHPGMGTRFTLYLPASTRAAEGPDPMADTWRDVAPGGTERVLLVEDDTVLRTLLARVLRSRGYSVDEAPDGARGLSAATAAGAPTYDLVVSDLRTPRLGGATLARHLGRALPTLPVLFVTGHPDDLDPDGTLDGHPVLAKPFTAVQLLHAMRGQLDAQAPRGARRDGPTG
jgi:two-component system, cell cycle sensor histidine kinase and response regulator CckA